MHVTHHHISCRLDRVAGDLNRQDRNYLCCRIPMINYCYCAIHDTVVLSLY